MDDRLSCWYHGFKIPTLMLKPIKVEMVLRSPPIYIFRDIISDNEAEELKNMARPMVCVRKLNDDNDDDDDDDDDNNE